MWKCLLFAWLFLRLLEEGVKVLIGRGLVVAALTAGGSAELCGVLQQQLLQALPCEPLRELFHMSRLSAF